MEAVGVWAPTYPQLRACAVRCIDVTPAHAPAHLRRMSHRHSGTAAWSGLRLRGTSALGYPEIGGWGRDCLSTSLLLEGVADHGAAGLDADCAVGIGARALNADAGVDNLLQNTPINDAAVVQAHQFRISDRVVLVRLEQEQVRVLRRA